MKKRVLLSAHQMFFFMSTVAFSFNVILMQSSGLSNTLIGIILATNSVVTIIMQPAWGFVSDWIQSVRKVFIFCTSLSCLSYCLLAFFKTSAAYMIIFPISTAFSCVLVTLVNTTCLVGIENERSISYGSLRLWGSLGYALMSFIIGRLFSVGFSINIIFPIYVAFALANIVLTFFMEDSAPKTPSTSLRDMNFGALFKNYYFLTCVISLFICYIPVAAAFSYSINVFENLGGSAQTAGTIFALRALAEVPFFIMSATLIRRFGARKILILSLIFMFFVIFTYGMARSLSVAFAASIMHGSAYCLLLTSSLYCIFELSPLKLRTTAQTISTTAQIGLGAMVGNFLAGTLIDTVGVSATFSYLSILSALGLAFFVITSAIGKKRGIPMSNQNV